ncbi:MAG: oxygen-independent coproporphyrinogen III oxidase-like protein [Betaproteobacteria bacterium]|nr:oxygen-independent coproporphyrinogen III oxidase-like protein [Betaproteobacteria bacterium]
MSAANFDLAKLGEAAHWLRPGTLQLPALPPLSLYVHLPWCLKKCPYCDFNSHALGSDKADLPQAPYLQALAADLQQALPLVWGRPVHSVFLGGGTPSLFEPWAIEQLLGQIRALLPLVPDCEITMEANPGTFETDRFHAYRCAGVTRLSVGVQSFHNDSLRALGRVHDADQAVAAVQEAAQAFETFNIDLMYALPGQTLSALQHDLDTALGLAPPHLSIYHLTIEPNTWFERHPPALPAEDEAYDMLDMITQVTAEQGLSRYEVSAYARRGHACWHNTNYWQFGDYLGIGAGAHSKISFPHRVLRLIRYREPALYMKQAMRGQAVSQGREVKRQDLAFEFALNAFRLAAGFALGDFSARTGLPLSSLEPALAQALQQGLIERFEQRIKPSERGFDFLNDLVSLFLPPEDKPPAGSIGNAQAMVFKPNH